MVNRSYRNGDQPSHIAEVEDRLDELMERAGVDPTQFAKHDRKLIEAPGDSVLINDFAEELGSILASENFFTRGGELVWPVIDYRGAVRIERVDAQTFRTRLEEFVIPFRSKKGRDIATLQIAKSITRDVADATVCSRAFLERLRVLHGVEAIRLPVLRATGEIELLPEGYDDQTKTVTFATCCFDTAVDVRKARKFLRDLLKEFCFFKADRQRSESVSVAAMLTPFCKHLLPARTLRPCFIYSANAPGAGKTLLAKLAIATFLGYCPSGPAPCDEAEWTKRILSAVLAGSSILFIDNAKDRVASGSLEGLLTSPVTAGRVLGVSRHVELDHNLNVFITSNDARFSPDMRRRSLVIELFLPELRPEDRVIQTPLDDAKIIELRSQILAALWALVHEWAQSGQPKAQTVHPSFTSWSEIIGGILECNCFESPCTTGTLAAFGGDQDLCDFQKLARLVQPDTSYPIGELVKLARAQTLFVRLWPDADADEVSDRRRLGSLLSKYVNRIANRNLRFETTGTTKNNRAYRFKKLEGKEETEETLPVAYRKMRFW